MITNRPWRTKRNTTRSAKSSVYILSRLKPSTVHEDGSTPILGLKIALRETKESWKELLRELKGRGLRHVEVATSDAHEGLEAALRQAFPGCIWNRCQAHFRRNVLDKTPSGYRDRTHQLLDRMLKADSPQEARRRLEEAAEELEENAPAALAILKDGLCDATAVLALPDKYRRRLRTTNIRRNFCVERLIQEVRRREKVIRIFPSAASAWRLIGALLAETHEEWSTGRRYLKMDAFYQWRDEQAEEEPIELQSEPSNRTLQPA